MKIAIVVSSFPNISETFIVNQICDLIDRGHQVKIFSFEIKCPIIHHEKIQEYDLLDKTFYYEPQLISKLKRYYLFSKFLIKNRSRINFDRLKRQFSFSSYKSFNLRFFYENDWLLKDYFDVVHAHFGPNAAYIAKLRSIGFFHRTRFISTFHGYDLAPSFMKLHEEEYKGIFEEADVLTVNSLYSKNLLAEMTSKHIVVHPVGLDTNVFVKKNKKSNKEFTVLFVGRLIELKGPHLAILTMTKLITKGYRNIKLVMVGEGEMMLRLKELIKENKLEDFVQLKGAQTQGQVIQQMNKADVFFFPGITDSRGIAETQGLVVQEAQAMELPVVVSDAGGVKYGILADRTGYVVKENDIEGFAAKIEFLLINKAMREMMGIEGRKFVVKYYDSRVLGKRLEKYYMSTDLKF